MPLPKGLTREHIEQAIAQLDTGAPHPFGASKDYDFLVNGKAYPPKAVVGLAASLATGTEVGPGDFSAGEGPGQANAVLRSLGFTSNAGPMQEWPSPCRIAKSSRGTEADLPGTTLSLLIRSDLKTFGYV